MQSFLQDIKDFPASRAPANQDIYALLTELELCIEKFGNKQLNFTNSFGTKSLVAATELLEAAQQSPSWAVQIMIEKMIKLKYKV